MAGLPRRDRSRLVAAHLDAAAGIGDLELTPRPYFGELTVKGVAPLVQDPGPSRTITHCKCTSSCVSMARLSVTSTGRATGSSRIAGPPAQPVRNARPARMG